MALAFIKETFATEAATASSLAITPANTAGNLVVLCVSARGTAAPHAVSTVTDTGGNTWTLFPSATQQHVNLDCEIWYSNTTAIAGTVTVDFGATNLCSTVLSCQEFSGQATSGVADIQKGANGSGTSADTGTSGTTSQANEVVVAFVGCLSTTAFSNQAAGYNVNTQHTSTISSFNCTAQSAYRIVSSATTHDYSITNGNNTWCAILATFKAASGTNSNFLSFMPS